MHKTVTTPLSQLIIGIADVCEQRDENKSVSVGINYPKAISLAGHVPVVIAHCSSDDQLENLLRKIDILVMPGGEDLHPSKYNEKELPETKATNNERDAFDWRLLTAAKKTGVRVFGICRGYQMLNVFYGGSLWQDLPTQFPVKNICHQNVHHPINIRPDSRLAKVLETTTTDVNSTHHQAIKNIAPGFKVTAESPEGVIEAFESDIHPVAGVQFHPEKLIVLENNELMVKIFSRINALFKPAHS